MIYKLRKNYKDLYSFLYSGFCDLAYIHLFSHNSANQSVS